MPTFQMQAEMPHALLFLSDDSSDWTLPELNDQALANTSADCICFNVLSFVDGASLVTVSDKDCVSGGKKRFAGVINCSTGRLSVSDTTTFKYLIIPVQPGHVQLELWSDEESNPTWVWIKLDNIRMSDYENMKLKPY